MAPEDFMCICIHIYLCIYTHSFLFQYKNMHNFQLCYCLVSSSLAGICCLFFLSEQEGMEEDVTAQ